MPKSRARRQTSELLDRTPPNNLEAERAVIGSVILDNTMLEVVRDLRPGDFHNTDYGLLWGRMLAMAEAGMPLDAVTIPAALKAAGEWDDGGDRQPSGAVVSVLDLAECAQSVPVAAHARYYADMVLEASFRRRVIRAALTLVQRAWDDTISVERLRGIAKSLLSKIAGREKP